MGFVASVARDHFGTPAAAPLQGLSVLDVGSGGGLLCESLARLGPSSVLGVDASPDNVRMARAHAGGDPTLRALQYRHCTAEALVAAGRQFDLVCSVEVIEHVHDAQFFAAVCLQLVRPGGLLVLSTLSRTAKSYLSAIIGAEYVLRWVPPGTHDWHKFLSPYEMQELLRSAHETPLTGLYPRLIADSVAADSAGVKPARRSVVDIGSMTTSGMLYRPPPRDTWELDGEDFESNYIAAFKVQ
jgi:ubiquinone biosynthesis O-methyltransferase